jgi:hypothetical protein
MVAYIKNRKIKYPYLDARNDSTTGLFGSAAPGHATTISERPGFHVVHSCPTRVQRRLFGGIFAHSLLKCVADAEPNRAYSIIHRLLVSVHISIHLDYVWMQIFLIFFKKIHDFVKETQGALFFHVSYSPDA